MPNPPPLFVGRERELASLRASIARGPVSLVWGLGGLGKSALALQTLHSAFPEKVARTLVVRLQPSDRPEDPAAVLVRALASVRSGEAIDWPSLLADPEALAAAAID